MTDAPQAFAEQTWTLGSTEALGSTVQLSCGPFVHTSGGSLKADCKLDLRLLSAAPSSGWAAVAASDQTGFAANDNTAAVSARSTGTGDATVGLTVTFLNSDFSTLAAGDYTVTVTGTISAN